MPGVFLNLILVSFATLSLASGFSFFFREKESSYIRLFTIMFSGANFFICAGYSLMGFIPNVDFAYIPRFFGLVGIDVFLLFELVFLLFELKVRQGIQTVIIGFFSLYVIFDAVIFGQFITAMLPLSRLPFCFLALIGTKQKKSATTKYSALKL